MTGQRRIRGVFFDLYGTLLVYGDMKAAWAAWLNMLYAQLTSRGLSLTTAELADACEGLFSLPEPPPDGNHMTVFERRVLRLTQELGLKLDDRDISDTSKACVESWQDYVTLAPNALTVLEQLAGKYHLALISNFDHPPHAHAVLSKNGLAEHFEHITISAEIGIKKPDPRIFRPALAATGLKTEEVAYVGDSEEDREAALAAGMSFINIVRDRSDAGKIVTDFTTDWDTTESTHASVENTVPTQYVIASLSELPQFIADNL